MMKPRIHVVACVLTHKNVCLIAKRSQGQFAGFWEFPGGKVEADEKPLAALSRELFEELSIEVNAFYPLLNYGYSYPNVNVDLEFYLAGLESPIELQSSVHSQIKWVTLSKLSKYTFLESNEPIIRLLQKDDNSLT